MLSVAYFAVTRPFGPLPAAVAGPDRAAAARV